jgi:hypothetical protein
MDPNYLLKDEIEYELAVRGICCEVSVQDLRKIFLTNISRTLPLHFESLKLEATEEILGNISTKIFELQAYVEQIKEYTADVTARVSTRLLHLRGRLLHLTAGLLGEQDHQVRVQRCQGELSVIEQTIQAANEATFPTSGVVPILSERSTGTLTMENVRSLEFSGSSFTGSVFQKIANPLEGLIKGLPRSTATI